MALHMKRQVVRSRERPVTMGTFKWPCTSMLTIMTRQFVRPSKSPRASFPCALVWLFTSVSSHVGLEMGTLRVDFITASKRTAMCSPFVFTITRWAFHSACRCCWAILLWMFWILVNHASIIYHGDSSHGGPRHNYRFSSILYKSVTASWRTTLIAWYTWDHRGAWIVLLQSIEWLVIQSSNAISTWSPLCSSFLAMYALFISICINFCARINYCGAWTLNICVNRLNLDRDMESWFFVNITWTWGWCTCIAQCRLRWKSWDTINLTSLILCLFRPFGW